MNQTFSARFASNTYNISNTTAYAYYRLNVTANNGSTMTQLSELALMAPNQSATPVNRATGGTASASSNPVSTESAAQAFDQHLLRNSDIQDTFDLGTHFRQNLI